MNRFNVEPEDNKHYWWLPEFLADQPENPNHWSVQFCSSSNPVGRCGVFVGPLEPPTYELEK
jgi:hypothetical protein